MNVYTDANSLYDANIGIPPKSEKRLLVDPTLLCESFKLREINGVIWAPSEDSPADAMVKENASQA